MKVIHVSGSSVQSCSTSWIKMWRKMSNHGNNVIICCESKCNAEAVHGAHVRYHYGVRWYIVPTCAKHNIGCNGSSMKCKPLTIAVRSNPTTYEYIQSYLPKYVRQHQFLIGVSCGVVLSRTSFLILESTKDV